jgi:hypothetical protein
MSQKWAHREQSMAFEEMLHAAREAQMRMTRREKAIEANVPDWSLAGMNTALLRGERI